MNIRFLKLYVMALMAGFAMICCDDMDSIHEEYLNGEQVYAGKLDSLETSSGFNRVKILGLTQYLGNSREATVTWEDESQVFTIDENAGEEFEIIIENLAEKNYEFELYTTDNNNNQSVLQTVTGRAYGDVFIDAQSARRIVDFRMTAVGDSIIWANKAESEYVISTLVRYETNDDTMTEAVVDPESSATLIENWKPEGNIEIISTIISGDNGFDTVDLNVVQDQLPIPLPTSGLNKDWTLAATISVSNENGGGSEASEGSLKVIDGDLNTKYLYDYSTDSWMQQELLSEGVVNFYTLTSGNDAPGRDPKNWTLAGSNDQVTWSTLDTRTNESFSGRNETKEYIFDSTTPYKYYRMSITANNGEGLFQLSEWRLYERDVPQIDFTEYLLTALTVNIENNDGSGGAEGSLKVVDGDTNTKFLIFNYTTDFWIQQEFFNAAISNRYTLTSGNDAAGRDPKNWTLSGSNDGTTWTDLDTRTDETFAERNETKEYTFNSTTPYKYYRISITANNGDGLFQLSEWRMLSIE
ncbi:DUF4998 domain-containing protein [Winogradskyella bathintestinalis]|uniref:DUF4998 domain-containing protein n=1 Tax=Winogradskyella bathintestinalis TaxID=3035208 RepID=A0ABT7ZUP8_9FLAO|nr:DUF4998 domain-containing protein [Winogradskyella bathintestinalis]MDN3492738.1 DUF4998 domain-containing protein [Winogradskyella bathintestinalis]